MEEKGEKREKSVCVGGRISDNVLSSS